MIQKLEPRHFGPDSGFGGATFSDVIDKVNEIIDAMNGEHDPSDIYSEDGRLIAKKDESEDERIRQGLLKIFKQSPNGYWAGMEIKDIVAYLEKRKESLRDFIDDFPYSDQQEQKPSTGIYWHAIKRGEKLPCRAYIWNPDYEKYHDCWEGRLIPNLENISVGGDTWYLPADDVKNLPREGVDELQKEQKPNSTEDMPYITDERFYEREPADTFKYKLAEYMTKCCTKKEGPYGYTYGISAESILKMAEEELLKRGAVQKPAEWSEADEDRIRQIERIAQQAGCTQKLQEEIHDWLKDLRPSWKPSEEQMDALAYAIQILDDGLSPKAAKAGEELEHLREQLKKL